MKEEKRQTVAVAASDTLGLKGWVSPHFGHCRSWVFVEVEDGRIVSSRTLSNPYEHRHHCSSVSEFLAEQGAQVVISGGLGRRAHGYLVQKGIELATGYWGTVEESVRSWMRGERPVAAICDHHGERHRH